MTVTDGMDVELELAGRTSQDGRACVAQAIHHQAVVELAQEMTLVARAMFAQLLPDAGSYAVSSVPLGGALRPALLRADDGTPGAEVVPHHAAPVDVGSSTVDASAYSIAAPVHGAGAVALPAHEATSQPPVPVTGVPVPTPGEASTPASVDTSVRSVPVPPLEVPGLEQPGPTPAIAVPTTPQPGSTAALEVPSVAAPSLGVPVEAASITAIAVTGEPDETSVHGESLAVPEVAPDVSSRSSHRPDRSMAMLAEIGFLDE